MMAGAGPRRICVVTGTRAEYGLLRWLMTEIRADARLRLQVVATGTHLERAFGTTARDIEADGFTIDRKVPLRLRGDSPAQVTAAAGRALAGLGAAFAELRPHLVVLLGDRYEALAAAQAALLARIPLAHIHGGETTFGAIDESMRHAITKLAQLHFVAAPPYRRRVLQLGEAASRVFCFGPIGADNFRRLPLLDRPALARALDIPLPGPLLLVTYHPTTLGRVAPARAVAQLLAALEGFPQASIIFTGANADPGHAAIAPLYRAFIARHPGRAHYFPSLGQLRYLSALRAAAAVVGNSSSGIIEAPLCGTPTVNIGDRQRGRLRAPSVIDCAEERIAITRAISRALGPAFAPARTRPPSASRDVSRRIKDVLARVGLEGLTTKTFRDR
jgi:UDP-N-acetylglucosamine 2-epimerase (non-hydrolysing)